MYINGSELYPAGRIKQPENQQALESEYYGDGYRACGYFVIPKTLG